MSLLDELPDYCVLQSDSKQPVGHSAVFSMGGAGYSKDEYSRSCPYFRVLADPFREKNCHIPDTAMGPRVLKSLRYTTTWTGYTSYLIVTLFHAKGNRISVYYPSGPSWVYGFDVPPEENLSDYFSEDRFVAGGATFKSNTVSSGLFTVQGKVTSIYTIDGFDFSTATESSILSQRQDDESIVTGCPISNGVTIVSDPAEDLRFTPSDTNAVQTIYDSTYNYTFSYGEGPAISPGWNFGGVSSTIFYADTSALLPFGMFGDTTFDINLSLICKDITTAGKITSSFPAVTIFIQDMTGSVYTRNVALNVSPVVAAGVSIPRTKSPKTKVDKKTVERKDSFELVDKDEKKKDVEEKLGVAPAFDYMVVQASGHFNVNTPCPILNISITYNYYQYSLLASVGTPMKGDFTIMNSRVSSTGGFGPISVSIITGVAASQEMTLNAITHHEVVPDKTLIKNLKTTYPVGLIISDLDLTRTAYALALGSGLRRVYRNDEFMALQASDILDGLSMRSNMIGSAMDWRGAFKSMWNTTKPMLKKLGQTVLQRGTNGLVDLLSSIDTSSTPFGRAADIDTKQPFHEVKEDKVRVILDESFDPMVQEGEVVAYIPACKELREERREAFRAKHSGDEEALQKYHNKLMHAYNGNMSVPGVPQQLPLADIKVDEYKGYAEGIVPIGQIMNRDYQRSKVQFQPFVDREKINEYPIRTARFPMVLTTKGVSYVYPMHIVVSPAPFKYYYREIPHIHYTQTSPGAPRSGGQLKGYQIVRHLTNGIPTPRQPYIEDDKVYVDPQLQDRAPIKAICKMLGATGYVTVLEYWPEIKGTSYSLALYAALVGPDPDCCYTGSYNETGFIPADAVDKLEIVKRFTLILHSATPSNVPIPNFTNALTAIQVKILDEKVIGISSMGEVNALKFWKYARLKAPKQITVETDEAELVFAIAMERGFPLPTGSDGKRLTPEEYHALVFAPNYKSRANVIQAMSAYNLANTPEKLERKAKAREENKNKAGTSKNNARFKKALINIPSGSYSLRNIPYRAMITGPEMQVIQQDLTENKLDDFDTLITNRAKNIMDNASKRGIPGPSTATVESLEKKLAEIKQALDIKRREGKSERKELKQIRPPEQLPEEFEEDEQPEVQPSKSQGMPSDLIVVGVSAQNKKPKKKKKPAKKEGKIDVGVLD